MGFGKGVHRCPCQKYAIKSLNSRFFPAWATQMTSWIWSEFFSFKFCEKRMHGNCFQMNHLISNSLSFEKDIQYFTLREEIILHPRIFKISNFSFETCPNNMNSIFNICFVFSNSTSNQFPSRRECLYLSFLFNTFISNIDNILTFGWWRVNNEGTQIWTRVEKREKNEEYILVKDMEGLNGKNEFTRIEIFSQKGNNKKIIIFFPFSSSLILQQLWRKLALRWKSFSFVGFKFFFFGK